MKERKNMKKFMNKINNKINGICSKANNAMCSKKGEGYIDTGVKIIVGVVVGGIILAGLYALFNDVILPNMNTEINGMFNYAG